MANNRMWLVHRPTGLAVLLGKRMLRGWYRPPSREHLSEFYEFLDEYENAQDDFVIALEDPTESSCAGVECYFGVNSDGFQRLKLKK